MFTQAGTRNMAEAMFITSMMISNRAASAWKRNSEINTHMMMPPTRVVAVRAMATPVVLTARRMASCTSSATCISSLMRSIM